MTTPIKIFISYARKDGRELALKLKKSLEDAGYDIWLDTSEIEGGDSWGKRIETAIDERDAVLALMSPASYTSEICRAEQLRALRKHKRVIPIRVSEKADIPIWLEPLNYRDFSKAGDYDTAFVQVLADLGDTAYKPPVIHDIFNNAPALPPHFIPRPEEFNQLKDALLSDTTDRQVALTALRGLGGIGKSVMANVVCRDEFVSGAFPDGVFWVELGREPQDITGKLGIIGQGLGDEAGNYATLDNAISSLWNILKHKSALIVLDDVWAESLKVAQYFIGASPRTRWLITTRDQKIVDTLDATPIELGVMTPPQALSFIREWAGRHDDQFPSITEKLGYHPLGLKIVGARLRDMDTDEWVKNYDITRIKMGYSAKKTDDNLVVCFQVSVDSLPEELPSLYHALGIFPEDVWIPESMVAVLWRALNPDLSHDDCTDISIELAKLALIDRQRDKKQIRMHDLLHDYNRYKIRDQQADLQSQFVTALGDPYALPHVYAWRYYAYHLMGANRLAELRPLLVSYRWLDAKLRATDPKALIDDCDLWLSVGTAFLPSAPMTPPQPFKDETIHLIRSALDMSANTLMADKNALAHQLAGRLMHHYKTLDEIREFMDVVMQTPNNLFPAFPDSDYDIMNPAGGMLLRTMKHGWNVSGAIQLADGRILSWSKDKTLGLWQSDGTPITTLTGHTESVFGSIQLRDGRLLSWSDDNTLRLWESNGTPIATLTGHTDDVRGATQLIDGRLLSWSRDNTLRLWDADGTPIATLTGHTDSVRGMTQLADGRILSWSHDNTLRLWDADGSPIATLTGHTNSVAGAVQLADGRIASWSWDNTLRLWDSSGTPIATLTGHTDKVNGAVQLRDGRILSWAGGVFSYDNTLRLWGSDGSPIATLTGHTDSVAGAVQLADGRVLSWSGDSTLCLWDSDGTPLATLTGHTSSVRGAVQLGDGRIASWSWDNTLHLWDSSGSPIATLTGHTRSVNGAMQLADGRILSWSWDNTLRLWDGDGSPIATMMGHTDGVSGAVELADGRITSWASNNIFSKDKTLRLWGADGTPIATLTGHTDKVYGAVGLADGRILSWSRDNTLRLWASDGTPIATLTGHTRDVHGAVQLADGWILSWSQDNTLRLWDTDGTSLATLTGHTAYVSGATQLADGRIASWSGDNTLRLWNVDGTPIDMLEQNYYRGDCQIIGAWAEEHGLTLDDLYPPEKEDPLMAGGRVKWQWGSTDLIVYDPQTGTTIHTFYGDAPFYGGVAVMEGGRIVVAGDGAGRVLFLRWVGDDNPNASST